VYTSYPHWVIDNFLGRIGSRIFASRRYRSVDRGNASLFSSAILGRPYYNRIREMLLQVMCISIIGGKESEPIKLQNPHLQIISSSSAHGTLTKRGLEDIKVPSGDPRCREESWTSSAQVLPHTWIVLSNPSGEDFRCWF